MKHSRILLVLFALFSHGVWAGNEVVNVRRNRTALAVNNTFAFEESKFDYMSANTGNPIHWRNEFRHVAVKNKFLLSFNKHSDTLMSSGYALRLELRVIYLEWSESKNTFVSKLVSPNPVVEVEYKPGSQIAYTDRQLYQFNGGHQVYVTIESIQQGSSLSNLQAVSIVNQNIPVYLEAEIAVERYYLLSNVSMTSPVAKSIEANTLEVYWNYTPGAEEYELEWTHVDDYATNAPSVELDPATIPFSKTEGFRFNSSRIVTTSTFYKIPVLYERGYLLYRVRAVGRSVNDNFLKSIYTPWSDETIAYNNVAQFPARFKLGGHEGSLNWQNSISFAEEGKNKASVSYYDGTLRNRQVATKMNSQNETVVGQTIYDNQGRPAVQVLPVPTASQDLNFKKNLNKDAANGEYNKLDFESQSNCVEPAPTMNTSSGASNYYSPQNPNKTNENAFIPDAQGKPFTQTVYTPDNTGRIKAQSGVGPTHEINSGHETRYFYSKPFQNELSRLFGTEVGDASRYKKNMVIDANGQISVSYLDPQGRVVATALAGERPTALDALPSESKTYTDELLQYDAKNERFKGETKDLENGNKNFSSTFLVTDEGVRTFRYEYNQVPFIAICEAEGIYETPAQQTSQNRCYECVMKIRIELKDDCNNSYLVGLDGITAASTPYVIGSQILTALQNNNFVYVCGDPNQAAHLLKSGWETSQLVSGSPVTVPLPVGQYTISRILEVDSEAMDAYFDDFLKNNDCVLKFEDFVDDTPVSCEESCTECLQKLGEFAQYDINANPDCDQCMSYEEYLSELDACQQLCEPKSGDCDFLLEGMRADVKPFGQYGTVTGAQASIYTAPNSFPLSVYNENNFLPVKSSICLEVDGYKPNWRWPLFYDAAGKLQHYYPGEDGLPAYVPLDEVDGVYTPAITNTNKIVLIDGVPHVAPQYLSSLVDFIARFESSWANALILHHPEYGYYEFCKKISFSHDFDFKWQSVGNFQVYFNAHPDEVDKLLNPLGTSPNNAFDPYFNKNLNPYFNQAEYNFMKNQWSKFKLRENTSNVYYSMRDAAIITTVCVDKNLPAVPPSVPVTPSCSNLMCDELNTTSTATWSNDTWVTYLTFYLGVKKRIIEKKMTQRAIKKGYYNGCIGNVRFKPTTDNFLYSPYGTKLANVVCPTPLWDRFSIFTDPNVPHVLSPFSPIRNMAFPTQYTNSEQPCNAFNYVLYKEKTKNYYTNSQGLSEKFPDKEGDLCPLELEDDQDGEYDSGNGFEPMNCPSNDLPVEISEKTNIYKYYEDCGNCYQVRELENLLSGIAEEEDFSLISPNVVLNCKVNGIKVYSPFLDTKLFTSVTAANDLVQWNFQSQSAGLLQAQITRSSALYPTSNSCSVVMKMNTTQIFKDQAGVEQTFTLDWDDVKAICCMNPITSSQLGLSLAGHEGKAFSAYAYVQVTLSGKEVVKKFKIEGFTSNVDLLDCTPPVQCEAVPVAYDAMTLWNGLLFESAGFTATDGTPVGAISPRFTQASFVIDENVNLFSSNQSSLFYEFQVSDLLKQTILGNDNGVYWVWNTSTAGSIMTARIDRYTAQGAAVGTTFFEFKLNSTLYNWSQVKEFKLIKADDRPTKDPTHNFIATVRLKDSQGQTHFANVDGYTSMVIGSCTTASPRTNN